MDWLQPALADMRSRLETAKNTWVEYLAGEPQRLTRFRELAKALKARADELGNHQLVRLFDVVVLVSTRLPDPYPAGGQFVMLEMATAFLLAESILDAFTAPPVDLEQQVVLVNGWLLDAATAKADNAPPPGLRNDLVQQFNQTQLRGSKVAKEIISNLHRSKRSWTAMHATRPGANSCPRYGPACVRSMAHSWGWVHAVDRASVPLRGNDRGVRAGGPSVREQGHGLIAEGLSSLGLFLEPCLRGRPPEAQAVNRT